MATGPLILPSATQSSKQLDPTWQATFSPGIRMTTNKGTSSQPEELSNQVAKGKEKQVEERKESDAVFVSLF